MAENPSNDSSGLGADSASSGTEPTSATNTSPEGAKMGVRQGREQRKGRRLLPLELRLQLYDKVLQLREQGLSYSNIIKRIHKLSGVRLNKSHISYWVRGKHKPLGGINTFDEKPTPELAGLIGTMLSDGSRHPHGSSKAFWLGVKDREYVREFGRCLAKILGRKKPYKIGWSRSKQRWVLEVRSILLFNHLDKPWQELKPHIEANRNCLARFLRMFFDGEGGISGRTLRVFNTDYELLLYIQRRLRQYFGIETTGPHKGQKAGYRFRDPKSGKIYETKKQCYCLHFRTNSLPRFYRYVGFTIRRKQRRLIEAVRK